MVSLSPKSIHTLQMKCPTPTKGQFSECSSFNQRISEICQNFIWTLCSSKFYIRLWTLQSTDHWKDWWNCSTELWYKFQCLTIIKDVFCVGWSRQILRSFPLYSIVIISNAIASGTANTTDITQISTISTAVHFGTPIPLIRLQEATARYLKKQHAFAD